MSVNNTLLSPSAFTEIESRYKGPHLDCSPLDQSEIDCNHLLAHSRGLVELLKKCHANYALDTCVVCHMARSLGHEYDCGLAAVLGIEECFDED